MAYQGMYDATAQIPNETIAFAAGHCVYYGEDFGHARWGFGSYVCHLTISAEALETRDIMASGIRPGASPVPIVQFLEQCEAELNPPN